MFLEIKIKSKVRKIMFMAMGITYQVLGMLYTRERRIMEGIRLGGLGTILRGRETQWWEAATWWGA